MAYHNNTPQSILDAPLAMSAWHLDEEGNQIKFEGDNRAQRRRNGLWNTRNGHRGYSLPTGSSMKAAKRQD